MKQACYGKRLLACYHTLRLGAQSKASKVRKYFPDLFLMICEVEKELMTEKEKTRYGWVGGFFYVSSWQNSQLVGWKVGLVDLN